MQPLIRTVKNTSPEKGSWNEVNEKLMQKYRSGENHRIIRMLEISGLPETHNGLGLKLLGISGDEVLPPEIYEKLKAKALNQVRGTVQADILKEDQAQNTCIFSTEFALKLMGDVQEYFLEQQVRNFYSVRFPVIILLKPAPIPSPNWHLHWPMDLPMWNIISAGECRLMSSPPIFLSSSATEWIRSTV